MGFGHFQTWVQLEYSHSWRDLEQYKTAWAVLGRRRCCTFRAVTAPPDFNKPHRRNSSAAAAAAAGTESASTARHRCTFPDRLLNMLPSLHALTVTAHAISNGCACMCGEELRGCAHTHSIHNDELILLAYHYGARYPNLPISLSGRGPSIWRPSLVPIDLSSACHAHLRAPARVRCTPARHRCSLGPSLSASARATELDQHTIPACRWWREQPWQVSLQLRPAL